ncbi:MAG: hypothetical protein R3E01_00875 [Pirellulaceae bacterium]|nr:hypothetical protein [Planctomycetales bacterium]
MTCQHLKKLYQLCQENEIRLAATDLIHIVCRECGETEVCPSMLMEHAAPPDESDPATPNADRP